MTNLNTQDICNILMIIGIILFIGSIIYNTYDRYNAYDSFSPKSVKHVDFGENSVYYI